MEMFCGNFGEKTSCTVCRIQMRKVKMKGIYLHNQAFFFKSNLVVVGQ